MDQNLIKNLPHRELWKKIKLLDLEPICFKLINCSESGQPWSLKKAVRVEKEYRQFLFLSIAEGENKSIVPTLDIDHFWHTHILDTAKYAEDCQKTFGKFLHHFPYLGMRSEKDKENLVISFENTIALFRQYFGDAPADSSGKAACDAGSCGGCDHRGIDNAGILISRPRLSEQSLSSV